VSQDQDISEAGLSSGIALAELQQAALGLPLSEFEDRYGSAFLMLWHGDLANPEGAGATCVQFESYESGHSSGAGDAPLVHPIRSTGCDAGNLVTVGRTDVNDVVIPDTSVSRHHATFEQSEDGRFSIQDAGSTNGTAVNGASVPVQGQGAPVALESGDMVLIGQVCLRYLEVGRLREMFSGA
jgi:hypothetical protein